MSTATTTRERPILCSGPMVNAILEGRKSQTRRVINPQPPKVEDVKALAGDGYSWWRQPGSSGPFQVAGPVWAVRKLSGRHANEGIVCPYGQPGDRLWVRETFITGWDTDDSGYLKMEDAEGNELPEKVWYRATPPPDFHWLDEDGYMSERVPWRPSIHMPRWASRITLEITEVRVERLKDITAEDAAAEGVTWNTGVTRDGHTNPISAFKSLWNSINGKRPGCSWDDNPYVWAISFRRLP